MKLFTLFALLSVISTQAAYARREIVCDCYKIWKGGPAHAFYGEVINAGTVVGSSYSKALDSCSFTGRISFYNPQLRNCQKMGSQAVFAEEYLSE